MTDGGPGLSTRLWLLAVIGCLGALLLIELAVRITTDSLFRLGPKEGNTYADIDPMLGRIPKPGLALRHPSGFSITIGKHGTRSHGGTPAPADRPLVLVVGDSFAFGDGVSDEESFPAILERLSRRRVINGAIPGFGLDQIVLRAEQLAGVYAPDTIIVSFIPHDVLRCEMSYWSGHPKPYFDIEGGALRLQPAATPPPSPLAWLKRLLALSVTVDLLFPKFLNWEGPEATVVHGQGREVACLLMRRLAERGRVSNVRIAVLAQPQQPIATPEQLEIKDALLKCAEANGLPIIDLFPVIEKLPLEQRTELFPRHMSPEGNRLVAVEVAAFLEKQRR
jgi:hypothetical protein